MFPLDASFDTVRVDSLDEGALQAELRVHGLTLAPGEARRVAELLGRDPTLAELTLFDTMWSEHCSYKSSRAVLQRTLPTQAGNVVVGPVEDAGIVDFGEVDGVRYGVVIAHESHNHPSQVMPVEGAATGIGGIVRDVYCMGAEVVATLDPLRFGWPEGAGASRRLDIVRGVVRGIWQYGNAIGVPNLGGDVVFHPSFDENCLVNVVAVGIVDLDAVTHSSVPAAARDEPYDLILVGKPTDWSGMGGAAFASADLDAAAATSNRGSVQVADPFLKRVLTVANREVLALARREGAPIGFKDLGAGGIACVTSELADAGGFGCEVDLALVHAAPGEVPARVLACSETQERYGLAVPARLTERVLRIYNEDFALPTLYEGACGRRIGRVTTDGRYLLRYGERVLCEAPVQTITTGIRYEREGREMRRPRIDAAARLPEPPIERIADEWLSLAGHANLCSREYIYRHYDSEVQGCSVLRPGEADAGVIAPLPGCSRGIALAADGNPVLGELDPYAAGAAAVLEACRNVACVGGMPAAITDCLNFGNPERPEVFWQFEEAVRGIADACRGLGRLDADGEPLPVVSGNVSFYNQSPGGRAVAPSPIVACVGIVADVSRCRSLRFKAAGEGIYLVGAPVAQLGGSVYLAAGFAAGHPGAPPLDLAAARREIGVILELVRRGLATAVHDISEGGLAQALLEMSVGLEGQVELGAEIELPAGLAELTLREILFSERGGFVVTVPPERQAEAEGLLAVGDVSWWRLGEVNAGGDLHVRHAARRQECRVEVARLAEAWRGGLAGLLGGKPAREPAVRQAPPSSSAATPTVTSAAAATMVPGAPGRLSGARPRVAVLQLPGLNCEVESARAVVAAGGEAGIFRWTRPAAELARFDGYLVPGGFSYEDRVRAGAVAAKDPLLDVLDAAAAAGRPILGICNGCQVLVEAGLVPGLEPGRIEVALGANRVPGRQGYLARWIVVSPVAAARTAFCVGLESALPLPIAHAEGRFTHESTAFFDRLLAEGYVALRYAGGPGGNPNGSLLEVAGLTNGRGNVLALMPHPERASWLLQVPEDLPADWGERRRAAAGDPRTLSGPGPGRILLRRLVELC
jgi:phosphoribosylformylglycinamidine synthase II/phosphoribosylformylglycinamidine synthase I